jgi:uncharacterized membrane protein YkvA (DUF1232 family)
MSDKSPSSNSQATAGLLGDLITQARLTWRLFKDGRVSGWVKLIPMAALLYFLSPIDLIPDLVLPGLGEVDDIVLLLLALKGFIDLSPAGIVREHLDNLSGMRRGTRSANVRSESAIIDAPYCILNEASDKAKE